MASSRSVAVLVCYCYLVLSTDLQQPVLPPSKLCALRIRKLNWLLAITRADRAIRHRSTKIPQPVHLALAELGSNNSVPAGTPYNHGSEGPRATPGPGARTRRELLTSKSQIAESRRAAPRFAPNRFPAAHETGSPS